MKSCWDILKIEPTSDISSIKKAYAQLLKNEVSDEDVTSFQKAKEAFDEAIKSAKKGNLEPLVPPSDFTAEFVFQNEIHFQDKQLETQQEILGSATEHWKNLENTWQELIADKVKRKQISSWQTFFWEQELIDFEKFQFIQRKVMNVVFDHYYDFSQDVIYYLLETYHLEEIAHEKQVLALKKLIYFPLNLPDELSEKQKQRYYTLRSLLFESLKNSQVLEAEQLIEDCKRIYTLDPDLMTLEGIYIIRSNYYQKSDLKRADLRMQEVLNIDPEHHTAYLYHVFLSALIGNWQQEHVQIKEALTSHYVFDPSIVLGFVYATLGDYEKSSHYFIQAPDYLQTTFYKQIRQVLNQREQELLGMGATHDIQLSKERKEEMNKIHEEKSQMEKQKGGFSAPLVGISFLMMILFGMFSSLNGPDHNKTQIKLNQDSYQTMLNTSKNIGLSERITSSEIERSYYGTIWRFLFEFLAKGDKVAQENFIKFSVDDHYQVVFEKNMKDHLLDRNYTYVSSQKMADGKTWYLLSSATASRQLIVQINEDNRIVNIYGEKWTEVSEEEFDVLALKILRSYRNTMIYLTDYFLYSYVERLSDANINIYIAPDYIEPLLNKVRQSKGKLEGFHQQELFSSYLTNGEHCMVVKNISGQTLIVTFDAEQRVKEVYMDTDDSLSSQERQEIMSHLIPVSREN